MSVCVQSVPVDLCMICASLITLCARTAHRYAHDVIDNSPIRSVIFENRWMFESCAARIHSFS